MYIAIQMYILIYLNVSIWLKEETFSSLKESMNKLQTEQVTSAKNSALFTFCPRQKRKHAVPVMSHNQLPHVRKRERETVKMQNRAETIAFDMQISRATVTQIVQERKRDYLIKMIFRVGSAFARYNKTSFAFLKTPCAFKISKLL